MCSILDVEQLVEDHMVDVICFENEPYDYLEKEDGEYCIGVAGVLQNDPEKEYILINSLETRIFYKYPFDYTKMYLKYCSGIPTSNIVGNLSIQIIQVSRKPNDMVYYAVNKTRWLRVFQKKVRAYLMRTKPEIYKASFRQGRSVWLQQMRQHYSKVNK
jgi:hypothetical protein